MFNEIDKTINNLLENHSGYSISKGSGIPYQTVQDIRNGKAKLDKVRYETIKKLYEYAKSLGE